MRFEFLDELKYWKIKEDIKDAQLLDERATFKISKKLEK